MFFSNAGRRAPNEQEPLAADSILMALEAVLLALDRSGDRVAAAHVAMALDAYRAHRDGV